MKGLALLLTGLLGCVSTNLETREVHYEFQSVDAWKGYLTVSVRDCDSKPVPVIVEYTAIGCTCPYGNFYFTGETGVLARELMPGQYNISLHKPSRNDLPSEQLFVGRDSIDHTYPLASRNAVVDSSKNTDLEFRLCDK